MDDERRYSMIRQGRALPTSKRPESVLLLCFYDRYGISTVKETVEAMQRESRFRVTVLNLHEHSYGAAGLALHPAVNLGGFDALIVHNSVSYNVDNLRSLDSHHAVKLRNFPGAKILLKQDENHRFEELAGYIGETGFDTLFSCLAHEDVEKIYPPGVVGPLEVRRMLTGYVTPSLRNRRHGEGHRPIDIGYRGSMQPLSFGRLAYEKQKIGNDVARLLAGRGLNLNISSRWEERLGGDAWFRFLAGCKATLGVESGASVFDRDGTLQQLCARAEAELGPPRDDEEYAEAYLRFLEPLEHWIHYNQISPRHFEAAATGTLQIMYPGHYSGIFVAGRHFLPLERNYSNLEEVIDIVADPARRMAFVERAYNEIILDQRYWIEKFVEEVDCCIDKALEIRGRTRATMAHSEHRARNVLLVCAHDPKLDPRIEWIVRHAPSPLLVHTLGVVANDGTSGLENDETSGAFVLRAPRHLEFQDSLAVRLHEIRTPAGAAAVGEIDRMRALLQLDDLQLAEAIGAPLHSLRLVEFRSYLGYFLGVCSSILEAGLRIRGVDALIATDLDTLLGALLLKSLFEVPVLYDAHEYWADADVAALEFESQYWRDLETRLVAHVERCQTVSPPLAELMTQQFGARYDSVPNAEPLLSQTLPATPEKYLTETCTFLFQGNFAPRRGIDLLIDAWKDTDSRAILQLRGPDNPYKQAMIEKAAATGLLETRILFPPAVTEGELVREAAMADVGMIPYTPFGINYENCCPNKLSQYMAAGLPILANSTVFVTDVVTRSASGLVVDFSNRRQLLEAVGRLMNEKELRERCGLASREFFVRTFNWEVCSAPMYAALTKMTDRVTPECLTIFAPAPDRPASLYEPLARPSASENQATSVIQESESIGRPALQTAGRSALSSVVVVIFAVAGFAWRRLPLRWRQAAPPVVGRLKEAVFPSERRND